MRRELFHFFQDHHGKIFKINASYIHLGRSTSAARIAAFNPTYAAAPRTIRSRGFIQPMFGMARFLNINLILLEDQNNELAVSFVSLRRLSLKKISKKILSF